MLNLTNSNSLCRFMRRGVFALAVLLCLSAGLLFTGCPVEPEEENNQFIPVGKWSSSYDWYTVTETTVDYLSPESEFDGTVYPAIGLTGDIVAAVDFSDNAGVLIIKVTAASNGNTVGKYTGVYYNNYTGSTTGTPIQIANAVAKDYSPIEADTIEEARALFTSGNVGSHVGMWGSYTKE